jgi:lactate racemase
MRIPLAFGRGFHEIECPDHQTTVIEPREGRPLANEKAAFLQALERPIASLPLREQLRPSDRVMISFTDNTRATPNERIIPWLLEALGDHPRDQIVLINQLGTHRPNTREVVANYEVINHDCENDGELVIVGEMNDGTPATVHRRVVEADLRIVTGFIEPHFFAGFSGGPKGIIPGCAGLKTIQASHNVSNIGHPKASFGITDGNPLWEELLRVALSIGPSFLINVSLTHDRRITGVYAGNLREAHRQGCRDVKAKAMTPTPEPFDVVVTTNSGHPLDRNLYQGVKGMSAAARIVKERGTIILVCECGDGVPDGSPFDLLLRESSSPSDILLKLVTPGFRRPEQWQAQIQALVQSRAEVLVHSRLPDDVLRAVHLTPCPDISQAIADRLDPGSRLAVMPQGPLTIPYLDGHLASH